MAIQQSKEDSGFFINKDPFDDKMMVETIV